MSDLPLLSIDIRYEEDVVLARQRARQIAAGVGFSNQDQTSFSTAVSEVARNAFRYAGHGRVEFTLQMQPLQRLCVRVVDKGPGIADLDAVLGGQYASKTGLGIGLIGTQRLSDSFDIASSREQGTTVCFGKNIARKLGPISRDEATALIGSLARRTPNSPLEEVQLQNKELLEAIEALRLRQIEVERLNAELAETNRGVVALYAELDDRAESLRRASEYKSRFLSDMTHELRTPLNAVISLSRLLLDRADGDLTPEQEKQVSLINRSATSLGEMVNDLLDLAKIEAGKTELQAAPFEVADLLAALRGIFRPLQTDSRVTLVIDDPSGGLSAMHSDERKITQILRNLISNALKFTERGEVRVTATADGGSAVFTVQDTGIGIAPEHLQRIFEDFAQIDSPIQRRVRGTGLGLPLARKLAALLGGTISVDSAPGVGTMFTVILPVILSSGPIISQFPEPLPGQTA
ncbi:MAG: ATP-binding protein [Tepidisphaeraceae bacterium]